MSTWEQGRTVAVGVFKNSFSLINSIYLAEWITSNKHPLSWCHLVISCTSVITRLARFIKKYYLTYPPQTVIITRFLTRCKKNTDVD